MENDHLPKFLTRSGPLHLSENITQNLCLQYRSGSLSLRQLQFASLDLALHSGYTPGEGRSVFSDPQLAEVVALVRERG